MKSYVFDIEANGFLKEVTKVHCIALVSLETGDKRLCVTPMEQKDALDLMFEADLLIGHNIMQYDLQVLKKIYGFRTSAEIYDTLVASCILYPDEIRSLETWAKILKLKQEKVQHEDWSVYSENMGTRCIVDTLINLSVYKHLKANKHEHLIESGRPLEQQIAAIHSMQLQTGVLFDIEKAQDLERELGEKLEDLRVSIISKAPTKCILYGSPMSNQVGAKKDRVRSLETDGIAAVPCCASKTKSGAYTVATMRYFGEDVATVQGPYTKVSFRQLNPDSSQEVKELLLSLGWVPTEYNMVKDGDNWRATSPKLTEDSYDSLPPGLGKAIAEYNTLKHRRNFLKNADGKGAIASAISGNGRVQAEAFTCATNTSRYRHQGVVCNIPRVGSAYGEEFRSLFIVPEDSWMIGVDLSGIEARCLAHHILNGGYKDAEATADLILSPDKGSDFHSYNAKVWGCDRNTAKSVIYALLYGAGAKKLASILGRKESQGAKIKKEFYKAHPAIKQLMDALEKAYGSRGYLLGADGRPLYVRGVSRLLNTLLQQTAAVLFKKWMVYLDDVASEFLSAYGALPKQLLAYHDELGYELTGSRELAEHWGKLTCQAALEVGRDHGFYVPMAAEYKCGKSWRDTH